MKDLTPQQRHAELIKANILGSFNNVSEIIEKGGAKVPIGTTHNGYKKVAEGKWQKVSSHGMTTAEHRAQKNKHHQMGSGRALTPKMENEKLNHMREAIKHDKAMSDLNDDEREFSDEDVLGKENRPYKDMSKEDLHKLADKKAGRDRMDAIKELAQRYEESNPGRAANMSALDRKESKIQ